MGEIAVWLCIVIAVAAAAVSYTHLDVYKRQIFCRIAEGEASSYKIYEDEYTLAFLDLAGDAEGHTLVIPKQHTENLVECGEDTAAHLMETVKSVSEHYVNSCGYQRCV